MRALVLLALLAAPVVAGPSNERRAAPCHDMAADCRRIDAVRTRAGTIELYLAHDPRGGPLTPAILRRGEYLAMYALVAPGTSEPVIASFDEGGSPNAHHYESCGSSDSDWCDRILTSTARLAATNQGVVTLVVKTTVLGQRWGADVGSRERIVRRRYSITRTVRCAQVADAWECTIAPDPAAT